MFLLGFLMHVLILTDSINLSSENKRSHSPVISPFNHGPRLHRNKSTSIQLIANHINTFQCNHVEPRHKRACKFSLYLYERHWFYGLLDIN